MTLIPDDPNCEFCQGVFATVTSFASSWYALTYPLISGLGMSLGLLLALHGVVRLIWRWWHGINTFATPDELAKLHDHSKD